jgi:hypothetical protein
MGCGARLEIQPVTTCPSCGADLQTVGRWNEVLEWGETRKMGRWKYVAKRTAIDGLVAAGLWWMGTWLVAGWRAMPINPTKLAIESLIVLVAAFVVAAIRWKSAEREYIDAGCPVLDPKFTGSRP